MCWVKKVDCFLQQAAKLWVLQPSSTPKQQPKQLFLWHMLSLRSQLQARSKKYFCFGISQVEILDIRRKILLLLSKVLAPGATHKRRRRPMVAPLSSPGASPHRGGSALEYKYQASARAPSSARIRPPAQSPAAERHEAGTKTYF